MTMCAVLSLVSLKESVFYGWWSISLWIPLCASLLLCICSPNPWVFLSGMGVCCGISSSASRPPGRQLTRLYPDQTFVSLCHRRLVAALCMLYKINSNSNHCLFSELPSASGRVRHTGAAAPAHPFKFEVSRCRTSQFAIFLLPAQTRLWNDVPYSTIEMGLRNVRWV